MHIPNLAEGRSYCHNRGCPVMFALQTYIICVCNATKCWPALGCAGQHCSIVCHSQTACVHAIDFSVKQAS